MTSVVVVSASYDKQIRLWDATSGRTVKSFVFQDSQINSLYLLPDTGYLAVAGFGALRLYDLGTFLHSGSGAGGGAGASGSGSSANQAPPVYSSFESQSSMNFTSLAAVPLVCTDNSDEQSSTLSGSSRQLTESASSAIVNDHLLSTVVMADGAALLAASPLRDVSFLLVATSEDGHIRFFDTQSAVTLRMLKDIATGAAITCSAVSPDRRYLLTGNQMGQVSMWHLPSIVASVALEMKAHAHHKTATSNKTSDGVLASKTGGADVKAEEERAKAFGRAPLQDINFASDYSAIRSIAIEPLGRWAAVATNAGKVHFIRLARDASVRGSKAPAESNECAAQRPIIGVGACSDPQLTPRGQQEQHGMSLSSSLQISPQKTPGQNSAAGSSSGMPPSRLALTSGSAGSHGEGGAANNSCRGPRETIYRSALVVNELSSNVHRASDASLEGGGGDAANMPSTASGGASHPNSMGAVLLDHFEQQRNSNSGRSSHLGGDATAAPHDQPVQQSAAAKLAEELEMEVFDTIQAHYKYILRVLISPNAELLVTCSADYSVGRFLVPAALRATSPASTVAGASAAAKAAALLAADAPSPSASTRPSGTQKDDKGEAESESIDKAEVRNDTFASSLASTQVLAPTTSSRLGGGSDQPAQVPPPQQQQDSRTDSKMANSSPNENATAVTAASDNKNAAPDAAATSSPARSFGAASRGIDDGVGDERPQPRMEFQPLKPLSGHNRWVWDGVFSDCSNFLFTASSDNTLRMWNGLMTERPQSVSFVGHTKPVVAVLLCYDKRRLSNA
ncbi:hypothetical protein LSCM4_06473 [Leishmania orientalis]|uniref:Guanine nucleotide-binding protein subunit beta-like protein n=1 Tax=Leishmania orientalis TaxID=2249476 RepID=A0A836HGL2_9TRYP|nr:hypothetical protein LSCM4_06473 [Leishmania orientalis]